MNRAIASVLAVSLLAAGGCKKNDEIPVGVNLPLSGDLNAYGKATLEGIKLRVRQINDAGGIGGKKIRLEVQDNRGNKSDTRSIFKKLAGPDAVVAVLGPITSSNALGAKMDAQQTGTPLITPTATNDTVTDDSRFVFRACFNDSFQGRQMARYVLQKTDIRRAALMIDRNSDYAKGLGASFKEAFEAGGGKVVAEEGYQPKDTNFGAQIVRIKAANAQTIFIPGYPPALQQIIEAARVNGFAGRLCGADGWDNPAIIKDSGPNIEGCFFMAAYYPGDKREIVRKFVKEMETSTGHVPGTFEALGYDSMLLLGEAMKKGATRAQIADALRDLKNVEAVTGTISITPSGDAVKSAVILKVVKGPDGYRTELIDTVQPAP